MTRRRQMPVVRLELARPGPSHNQLLSPLTQYLALCGDREATTLHLPFEHHELKSLLADLERAGGEPGRQAQDSLHQQKIAEIGKKMAAILEQIPALNGELSRAGDADDDVVQLRLVSSAAEIALIPFEMAQMPSGFPGEGRPLVTQTAVRVCITRELRRPPPVAVEWARRPRVLFVSAAPPDVPPVPFRAHWLALKQAMRAFERHEYPRAVPDGPPAFVTLQQASLSDIRAACAAGDFTHVHILAHGTTSRRAGELQYAVALHDDEDRRLSTAVTGDQLAEALRAQQPELDKWSAPLMVTLATCDSGNVGSVVIPGASIAHQLHAADIPLIIASQLPLTVQGSVVLVEEVFGSDGVLWGHDPRLVVHRLRQRLKVECPNAHDWASVVVYASLPNDFDRQLAEARHHAANQAVNGAFAVIDDVLLSDPRPPVEEFEATYQSTEADLGRYIALLARAAVDGSSANARERRAETFGLLGSAAKRQAQNRFIRQSVYQKESDWMAPLAEAERYYSMAWREFPIAHWAGVQRLSLEFIVSRGKTGLGADGGDRRATSRWQDDWVAVKAIAEHVPSQAPTLDRAWAECSLLELWTLAVGAPPRALPEGIRPEEEAFATLDRLIALDVEQRFVYASTRRQMARYSEWWRPTEDVAMIARKLVAGLKAMERRRGT